MVTFNLTVNKIDHIHTVSMYKKVYFYIKYITRKEISSNTEKVHRARKYIFLCFPILLLST